MERVPATPNTATPHSHMKLTDVNFVEEEKPEYPETLRAHRAICN